jgi:hypothetical protein
MIKLIDILKEVSEGLIGPFYHETDKGNVESILKNGIKPSHSSYTYDAVSLSPAAPSGLYGDAVVQVFLNPAQFKRAVIDTYHTMESMGMHLVDKRDVELAEKLIDRSITSEEYQELVNRALRNEGFFSGEILVRETIPADQIEAGITEANKGLWYYINRKKKLGLKSSPKNSKEYKAAVKAGKELSNEGGSLETKVHKTPKGQFMQNADVKITRVSEDIDDPVQPGILKKRLGKLSCTRVKAEKAKLKDKGTHYAKALQRYLNYHCND